MPGRVVILQDKGDPATTLWSDRGNNDRERGFFGGPLTRINTPILKPPYL